MSRVVSALAAAAGVAATAGLVAATAGCGPDVLPWAARAEEYVNALNAAFQTGFTNTAPFYAQDASFDARFLARSTASGRQAITQSLRDNNQNEERDVHDSTPLTRDEPLYLSADGAVDPMWLHADPYIVHLAATYTLSPEGITSTTWAGQVKGSELYLGVPISAMDPLAHGYLDAWASRDPAALGEHYADDAVLRDSLAGISLHGASAISGAANATVAAGGLPRAALHEIPDGGGPAYYLNGGAGPAGASRASTGWSCCSPSTTDRAARGTWPSP